MVDFTNLNNPAKTTTTAGTAPADVYNPNPYDWKTLLANYVDPTTAQYQTQARPFTPSYGYELTQLMTRNGQPPALRYDVADPAAASSAYANTVLQDYNTRNPTKTSSTFNQAALDNYIKNYNSANNINLAGFKKTVTPEQQAAILAQYGGGKTAVNDSMYNKYIKNYNTSNDLTAASEQQKIVDEYNASRTANQNTYNTNVADYNTRAADVQANPQTYYKPIEQYTKPVVQNAYYNKFATKAACGGLMRGYADGGVVQPQQPMVQDMMQRYNIQRQPIRPLNALSTPQQAPMAQPQQAPMMQPQQAPMAPQQQAPMAQPRPFYNGGAVRGYAGGDLVTDDGGQAFADSYMAGQQQFPTQQDAPIAQMAQRYNIDPEQSKSYADQRALLAQLQTALSKQQPKNTNVSNAETYFKLMGALGKPTKYGSFGESFGNVGEVMAEDQAARREAARANAGQDIANIQARMGLMQAQRELGRDERQSNMIATYLGGSGTGGAQGKDASGLPDNMKALLLSLDPKDAVKTLVDLSKEQNKPSDLIRGVNFLVNNGSITPDDGNEIVRRNLTPKVELMDVPVPQLGGTVKMDQDQYRDYKTKGIIPGATKAPSASTLPTDQPVKQTQPITQEALKSTAELNTERNKKAVEAEAQFANQQQFMKTINMAGDTVLGILKNNPKAVGYLSNKSLGSAVGTLVTNGIDTPWGGSLSMDVAPVLMKIDPKISQADLNALSLIGQPLTQIELGITKLTMKGDGTISNMERALPKGISGSSADPAQVLANKINFLKIAATKQDEFYNKMSDWTANNPGKTIFDFTRTPEAKAIENKYDNTYRKFAKSIGIDVPTPAAPSSNLLEQLKQERIRRQNKG